MRSITCLSSQRVSDDSNIPLSIGLANFLHDDDNHRCGTLRLWRREHLGFPRMVLGLATVIRPTHMHTQRMNTFLPACGVCYDSDM